MAMIAEFWDRERETARIRGLLGRGALGFVTGRRRIGRPRDLQLESAIRMYEAASSSLGSFSTALR